jgi:uncharacterized protein (TIGR03083 family)
MERDPQRWIRALRHSHDRLTALAGPLGPVEVDAASRARGWSIAQVLSHLGSQAEIFTGFLDAALAQREPPAQDTFPPIWEAWNSRTPPAQVADSVTANEAFVRRLELLSDAELESIQLSLFGMEVDAVRLLQMRLSEHALHTWDVAAALDPTAQVAADAVELLVDSLPGLAQRVGKADGHNVRIRIVTVDPVRDVVLVVDDGVHIEARVDDGPVDGTLRLPAEALVLLVYGRLDPSLTRPVELEAGGLTLDDIRAVFPGL